MGVGKEQLATFLTSLQQMNAPDSHWAVDWLHETLAEQQNYVIFEQEGDRVRAYRAMGQFCLRWG